MNDRLIAKTSALGLAVAVTLSLLAGVDALAIDQHAATAMAKAAATPAQTAATKAPGTRS
jgi:hypothetical protein